MASNPAIRLVKKFRTRRAVAAHFDITKEAVRLWLKRYIPPERALDVEEAMSGDIKALEILRYARARREERRA